MYGMSMFGIACGALDGWGKTSGLILDLSFLSLLDCLVLLFLLMSSCYPHRQYS